MYDIVTVLSVVTALRSCNVNPHVCAETQLTYHMYAIRSWFFVRFVTTHTETKTKWQRHSAVRKVKWKAKLLKHSNSHPDAVHNNAHPALGSHTRVETSAARPCLRFISASTNSGWKDRTASQRWRYCLRRTSSSDSLSSNHVLLLCKTILKHFLKGFLEGKITDAKWRKSADKSLWRMRPLQYDLRSPAAKDNSITNTATARSNLDAAITMRSAETELQNAIEVHATASEIVAPQPDLDARAKKDDFEALFKRIFRRKIISAKIEKICWQITVAAFMQHHLQSHLQWGNDPRVANHNGIPSATHPPAPLATPFTMRERSYSCKSQWNSVDRTCTKNRWHHIYNAKPIREWSAHDLTTHATVSQPSHRRGRSSRFGDGLCMEKHRLSCICYLSKTHFVRDFLQNSIGNSSTSTTCNPIYSEGTVSLLTLSLTNSFFDYSFPD